MTDRKSQLYQDAIRALSEIAGSWNSDPTEEMIASELLKYLPMYAGEKSREVKMVWYLLMGGKCPTWMREYEEFEGNPKETQQYLNRLEAVKTDQEWDEVMTEFGSYLTEALEPIRGMEMYDLL